MVRAALALFLVFCAATGLHAQKASDDPVNILFVTVDDMNWNSVGAFGSPVEDITPNIDALAKQGRRFERAYVAAANCAPSRVAMQTGLYPQQSGATGFFYIDDQDSPTIAGELRANGYYTGVINKNADTNPGPVDDDYWDYKSGFRKADKYSASAFAEKTGAFFASASAKGQPFYLVVNIADPHKPNFNDPQAVKIGGDIHEPSRIYSASEVPVPGFLPDVPKIRRDVRNYYNSVKRADDTLGAIMRSLRESGLEENTLVIFLSDHGMPFPFAKSSVYDNGLRTPLIMKWAGEIKADSLESEIVGVVDLMPTILDAAEVPMPTQRDYLGQSLLASQIEQRAFAFGSFDENAKGYPVPMRGVISKDWSYAFNAWADGEHTIKVADMNHLSYKQLVKRAPRNAAIQKRLDRFLQRPTEELCNLNTDPDCLVNLADDPAYAHVLAEMQAAARAQMVRTGDYLLPAFDVRDDREKLRAFMRHEHASAQCRASRLAWKRAENIGGATLTNTALFRRIGH